MFLNTFLKKKHQFQKMKLEYPILVALLIQIVRI